MKAGTTWTQQILHLLLRDGEPGGKYNESVPWLEALCSDLLGPREAPTWLSDIYFYSLSIKCFFRTLDKINNNTNKRYFKSHATIDHIPKGKAKIKIIYVARNPKDTVVSLYHHSQG